MKSTPSPAQPVRLALALLLLTVALCSCAKDGGQGQAGQTDKKKKGPVPVLTVKTTVADVPVEFKAIGVMESPQSSPIRSQLGGILTSIRFQEGDLDQHRGH